MRKDSSWELAMRRLLVISLIKTAMRVELFALGGSSAAGWRCPVAQVVHVWAEER